jgi:type IV pilus assembly protein PilM
MDLKKEIHLSDLIPSRGSRAPRAPKARPIDRRRVMPKEIVGLKIGSAELSAAQVVNEGSKRLVRVARAPLAGGIVSGGEVRDPAGLAGALSEFFAANSLPRRGVQLGLGSSRIGVRLIEIAEIEDEAQLENMIRFRAHEMISASLDEAMIDYHIVGSGVDADGGATRRILLVVAYRDSIDRYLAATDAAGLDVVGIDLEAFALLRATAAPTDLGASSSALVAVSIDHERTTLAISDGAICHFTRVIEWGHGNIDAAVARGLSLSGAEAAAIWRGPAANGDTAEESPHATRAAELARHELQTLVRELQSSIRFYQSQPNALPVEAVHLSGVLIDLPGVAEELRSRLDVGVTVIDPLARFGVVDTAEQLGRAGALTVALGLGIED